MIENFAPKLARVLTEYSVPIQRGDLVMINAPIEALPLIEALYEAVLARGGHPVSVPALPSLRDILVRNATDEQLDFLNPLAMTMMEKADVLYSILAPSNTMSGAQVPPERSARLQKAQRPVMETYFKRSFEGSLRWNICAWPTQADAQQAEMGLLAYSKFIYRACALDQPDPVAHWQAVAERQDRLIAWLAGKERVEVRGPGVDLAFRLDGGRTWINCRGDKNFPDGEIFTCPLEDSVNGTVAFSYPTISGGREVRGISLTFENGRVVRASAEHGEDYLLSQLDLDDGARTLGEFAIGTNKGIQRFTGETLFDEKIGGTIHMALGQSIEEAGGTNKSQIHWDIVHSMRNGGEIWVDGDLFYQNGDFVMEA